MTKWLVLAALLAGCQARTLRVVVESDRRCVVLRDGQEIAGRWSPGIVYSEEPR